MATDAQTPLQFKQVVQVIIPNDGVTPRVILELGGKLFYFDVPHDQQESFVEALRKTVKPYNLVDCGNLQHAIYRLQSFLYELLRDVAPVGQVERIRQNILKEGFVHIKYSNQFLANYAFEIASTILSTIEPTKTK